MKKKRLITWLLLLSLLGMLSSCGDSISVESGDGTASVTPEPSTQSTPIRFLARQEAWVERIGATLNPIKGREAFAQWLMELDEIDASELVSVEDVSGWFEEPAYKVTSSSSRYLYYGELKDFYADGFGILMTTKDTSENTMNIVYMGKFSKGSFDGYGIKFSIPDDETRSLAQFIVPWDINSEEYIDFYYDFVNYASFEGVFDEGKPKKGKGNAYGCTLKTLNYIGYFDRPGLSISDIGYQIVTSEYEDGEENGDTRIYNFLGHLEYDGEMKDGLKNGKGNEYYYGGKALKYSGQFKDGLYDGNGTYYSNDGQVIFNGKWEKGVSATGIKDNEPPHWQTWMLENIPIQSNSGSGFSADILPEEENVWGNKPSTSDGAGVPEYDADPDSGYISADNLYILPTDTKLISYSDLTGLSKEETVLARNEIYARYGYSFQSQNIRDYFNAQSWYRADPDVNASTFGTSQMSEIERANLETIQQYERNMGWK